ncbi:MAG TPA: hypothetical protein DER26_02145 [Verrucomicrobia bacterium]|nr:hypothetical protein [Verrucomicrobiota bacterium]
MKKVLLYFGGFSETIGGSEWMPLLFAEWLQPRCRLTFATNTSVDFGKLAQAYGIRVDPARMECLVLKNEATAFERVVGRAAGCTADLVLRRFGKRFDICISCHNPRDFGRPAVCFLHMLYAHDPVFAIRCNNHEWFPARFSAPWWIFWIRRFARRFVPGLPRRPDRVLVDSRETIVPNSNFVKQTLEKVYGIHLTDAFYPPTLFSPLAEAVPRDRNIVYIGRIHEEKGIDTIIDTVAEARRRTGQATELYLAGVLSATPYCERLKARAARCPWIHLLGGVYGRAKQELLAVHGFAIHVERTEAFGISITEYLKAGVVPVVPDSGGACEIVSDTDLSYATPAEAVAILTRLLTDPAFCAAKQVSCKARGERFTVDAYRARQDAWLARILAGQPLPGTLQHTC